MPFIEVVSAQSKVTVTDRKVVAVITDYSDGDAVILDATPPSVSYVTTTATHEVVVTDTRMGPPGGSGGPGSSFLYVQSVASNVWTINHNLGQRPVVEVRDNTGGVVFANVTHLSVNTVRIGFSIPYVGTAYLTL